MASASNATNALRNVLSSWISRHAPLQSRCRLLLLLGAIGLVAFLANCRHVLERRREGVLALRRRFGCLGRGLLELLSLGFESVEVLPDLGQGLAVGHGALLAAF